VAAVTDPKSRLEALCWSRYSNLSLIRALWKAADDDIWAVGYKRHHTNGESIHRWNGREWNAMQTAHGTALTVWGSGPKDVWISTEERSLLRWDGERFSAFPIDRGHSPTAIWGSRHDDVWANGPTHGLWRFRGTSWTFVSFSEPVPENPHEQLKVTAFWGTGPNDIWAVGYFGAILHFDGSSWKPHDSKTREHLLSVWGSGPNDVWAAGGFGIVLRFDGSKWSTVPFPPALTVLRLWGTSSEDLWASADGTLYHWDGRRWTSAEGVGGAVVWGFSKDDLWAVDRKGLLWLHRDCAEPFPPGSSGTFALVRQPAAVETRLPDTLGSVPAGESEARTFLNELLEIAKANDLERWKNKVSWKQRVRNPVELQMQAWKSALLRAEPDLPNARFETRRDGSSSTISFHVAGKRVLTMTITREGGELRLDEN
jgi:hypothetical protein